RSEHGYHECIRRGQLGHIHREWDAGQLHRDGKCRGDYRSSELLVDEHAWAASEYYREERKPAQHDEKYPYACAFGGHRHERQRNSAERSHRPPYATHQPYTTLFRARSEHGYHECIRRGQLGHIHREWDAGQLHRDGKCGGDYGSSELLVDQHAWVASEY